ncbi:MAG: TetR/AcrR family transcriptional regulator [Actinomycetota bacterium]
MPDPSDTTLAPAPGRTRRNRGSEVVRSALLEAAIGEFAAKGFAGASGRRIAAEAGTHQSQINYHFASTSELWKAALLQLLDELDLAILEQLDDTAPDDTVAVFSGVIRGLVHFAASRPELNRIMMHEGAAPGERLAWFVDERLRRRHADLLAAWEAMRASDVAADVDPDVLYHSVIGAASLLYANAPEAELLGIDPADPALIERHAESLITLFLPGRTEET